MAVAIMVGHCTIQQNDTICRRRSRAGLQEVVVSTKEAFLPLLTPVIIIGGILTGLFTPTEAAVVASLYALFLGFFYKDLKLKDLPEYLLGFDQADDQPAVHYLRGRLLRLANHPPEDPRPDHLSLTNMSATPAGIMAMVIIIVLILGCFLEGNAIFIITIPIFLPIAQQFGIDLVNFGVVMTLLIMVGNLTPPVGMCLFAVSSFSKVSIGALSKEVWPYLIGILIVTILIAYVPQHSDVSAQSYHGAIERRGRINGCCIKTDRHECF